MPSFGEAFARAVAPGVQALGQGIAQSAELKIQEEKLRLDKARADLDIKEHQIKYGMPTDEDLAILQEQSTRERAAGASLLRKDIPPQASMQAVAGASMLQNKQQPQMQIQIPDDIQQMMKEQLGDTTGLEEKALKLEKQKPKDLGLLRAPSSVVSDNVTKLKSYADGLAEMAKKVNVNGMSAVNTEDVDNYVTKVDQEYNTIVNKYNSSIENTVGQIKSAKERFEKGEITEAQMIATYANGRSAIAGLAKSRDDLDKERLENTIKAGNNMALSIIKATDMSEKQKIAALRMVGEFYNKAGTIEAAAGKLEVGYLKTLKQATNEEKVRMTATQRKDLALYEESVGRFDKAKSALETNPNIKLEGLKTRIGESLQRSGIQATIKGMFTNEKDENGKYIGDNYDPEVAKQSLESDFGLNEDTAVWLADYLGASLKYLYSTSGKQVSDKEFDRMMDAIGKSTDPKSTLIKKIDNMAANAAHEHNTLLGAYQRKTTEFKPVVRKNKDEGKIIEYPEGVTNKSAFDKIMSNKASGGDKAKALQIYNNLKAAGKIK